MDDRCRSSVVSACETFSAISKQITTINEKSLSRQRSGKKLLCRKAFFA